VVRLAASGGYLEGAGRDVAELARPALLDELGVGAGDLPLHAQRVVLVKLLPILVLQEVVGEWGDVAQTLEEEEEEEEEKYKGEREEERRRWRKGREDEEAVE